MATNPLILPEPKYMGQGNPERLLEALEHFRDEVVFWATPIGEPEEKYFVTALSKLFLSWLFGKNSDEINPFALPYGVTRYAGGVSLGNGEMGEGLDRVAFAYSGAAEDDDEWIARQTAEEYEKLITGILEQIKGLDDPKVNFLTPAVLERIEPLEDSGTVLSCIEVVRSMPVQLAA